MMNLSREETIGKSVEEVFDESFALNLENILGKSRWHLTEIRNAYKLLTTNFARQIFDFKRRRRAASFGFQQQTGAIIVLENVTSRVKLEESCSRAKNFRASDCSPPASRTKSTRL
jgi:hypothetical protein